MKRFTCILLFTGIIAGTVVTAQEKEQNFGIKFTGFVKNDFFWDSRQTTCAREGHFLLWPAPEMLDIHGVDINDKPNFNFLAIQSRLSIAITGPEAFGAKTSGLIEGDFFAQSEDNINLLRMRHAFVKFNWTNTELLTGQYWNPLFVTDCFPGTVSFNTGTPLQSFARNPQIRLTQSFGPVKLMAAALSQRDYASRGPAPYDNTTTIGSTSFLRNSAMPDMHLQVHYHTGAGESGVSLVAGAGIAYKVLVPRLSSTQFMMTHQVKEKVSGLTAIAFTKITTVPITFKLQSRYGENIDDVLSVSGFAVKNVEDMVTGRRSYTPLQNLTFWGEIHTNGTKVQAGIMGGYLKNLGTKDPMSDPGNQVYGLATNISSLYRISPRVIFTSNKTKLAVEIEYTAAAYGSDYDVNYIPQTVVPVANVRGLMSVIHSF
ncbi:MAG: hypothetical protein WD578_02160 [Bacteroidales bacterium]